MKTEKLNHKLRRTTLPETMVFEENAGDHTRSLRLIRTETLTALTTHYAGQKAGQLGKAEMGDKLEIEGFPFEYEPGRGGWVFEGKQTTVILLHSCDPHHAAKWLKTFMDVEKESPGLLYVKNQTHIVGSDDPNQKYVASTKGATVTWFNHTSGHLLAAALETITEGSDHQITMRRMLHHECAHILEAGMTDWLSKLTAAIQTNSTEAGIKTLATVINPQYLPERMGTESEQKQPEFAEELAAEFLVEIYAHGIIEKLPWPQGIWLAADAVFQEMKDEICHDPEGRLLRLQKPEAAKRRVFPLPKTVQVPELS